MTRVFGLVLAGGGGRRMGGANKAALQVGGEPLLDRARRALAPARRIAVAGGRRLTAADVGGLPLLPDPKADRGPLAGLAAGLAWAEAGGADWLLSAPVDAPFLEARVFEALLDGADNELEAIVAEADGRPQWLTAALRPHLASAALAALDRDDRSIAAFVKTRRWRTAAIAGGDRLFLNINAPADLAAANALAEPKGS